MHDIHALIRDIRQAQKQIMSAAPYRDFGLRPNPGASKAALAAVERRIGRALPPTYREFLRKHDGWPRFYDGATLLGTASLGVRAYEDAARATFEAAETPVPDVGPPSRVKPRVLIPFGIDLQATTLFVFNPANTAPNGEMEVIAWVNEIGIRRSNFTEFLELILELCGSELGSLHEQGSLC